MVSKLAAVPTAPASESSPKHTTTNQNDVVSNTMREEERKMKSASAKEEENRIQKMRGELQEEDGLNGTAVDERFLKLDRLLSQSKVYAKIMMDRMQKQQAIVQEKAAKETARAAKKAEKKDTPAAVPDRRATRAGTGGTKKSGDGEGRNGEGQVQVTKGKPRQIPTRGRTKKDDGAPTITQYFGKAELESKSGTASVAEALQEAADSYDENSNALGAQNLRSARQPHLVSGGIMKPYQLEGLSWLASLYENGLNGILADEMGLGKTIQTISFLAFLKEKAVHGPFLVVGPLSTLSNWIEEFAHWTPEIRTVLYHGSIPERQEIRQTQLRDENSTDFPVVCTSFEICMNDQKFLSRYNWKFIIIDEGHRLKNLNCRLIKELKQYSSANRLLITGTPLQNNLAELWSLLNFLMPQIFDSLENFESWFDFSAILDRDGQKQNAQQERKNRLVASLHAILKPFLLRRVKTDVESSLPKKREYIIYAPLTNAQKELYREIKEGNTREYLLEKAVQNLTPNGVDTPKSTRSVSLKRKSESETSTPNKSAKSSRASTPASVVRSSRKGNKRQSYKELSDREFFKHLADSSESESIDEEEQEEIERAKTLALARKQIASKKLQNPIMQLRLACNSPHHFYWPWPPTSTPDTQLITSSGKMRILDRLLPALFARSHKVLLFSQFTTQLDLLETYARTLRHWPVCRIDGAVPQPARRAHIAAFHADPAVRLFLLSTRAGGQGINLAAADTVVLFDSDWNPQQDLQAMDRAHRIGQIRPVVVYRLATQGTVEQVLLEKADAKRRLERLVIQRGKFRDLLAPEAGGDGDGSGNVDANANVDGNGVGADEERELARFLAPDEYDAREKEGEGREEELLSDADLAVLMDRSDEAYERAARGVEGEGKGEAGRRFKVVETKVGEGKGGEGVLASLAEGS